MRLQCGEGIFFYYTSHCNAACLIIIPLSIARILHSMAAIGTLECFRQPLGQIFFLQDAVIIRGGFMYYHYRYYFIACLCLGQSVRCVAFVLAAITVLAITGSGGCQTTRSAPRLAADPTILKWAGVSPEFAEQAGPVPFRYRDTRNAAALPREESRDGFVRHNGSNAGTQRLMKNYNWKRRLAGKSTLHCTCLLRSTPVDCYVIGLRKSFLLTCHRRVASRQARTLPQGVAYQP